MWKLKIKKDYKCHEKLIMWTENDLRTEMSQEGHYVHRKCHDNAIMWIEILRDVVTEVSSGTESNIN